MVSQSSFPVRSEGSLTGWNTLSPEPSVYDPMPSSRICWSSNGGCSPNTCKIEALTRAVQECKLVTIDQALYKADGKEFVVYESIDFFNYTIRQQKVSLLTLQYRYRYRVPLQFKATMPHTAGFSTA